jgi:hypothetical protein
MTQFKCPSCGEVTLIPPDFREDHVRCGVCGVTIDLRTAAEPAFPAPALSMRDTDPVLGWDADRTLVSDHSMRQSVPKDIPNLLGKGRQECDSENQRVEESLDRFQSRIRNRFFLIAAPSISLLILLGVLGLLLAQKIPDLNGETQGFLITAEELPEVLVPHDQAPVQLDASEEISSCELSEKSLPGSETGYCVTIRNDPDGLHVRWKCLPGFRWYRVNLSSSQAVALWQRKKITQVNSVRTEISNRAAAEFVRCRNAVPPTPVNRDCLTELATVLGNRGIGIVLEARAENFVTSCACDGSNGDLFFALPDGIQEFQILGQTRLDHTRVFPGHYRVMVAADADADPDASLTPKR